MVVLDQIDGIEVPEDPRYTNGVAALQRLAEGLNAIYRQVRRMELDVERDLSQEHGVNVGYFSFGDDPELAGVPTVLVECFCHWYSVSAVNFAYCVNVLDERPGKPERNDYAKVLGPLVDFRNKIGAHYAGIMKDKRDNDAEKLLSMTPLVAWADSRFTTSPFTLRITKGTKVAISESLTPWVLTTKHEQLCERFPMFSRSLPDSKTNSASSDS